MLLVNKNNTMRLKFSFSDASNYYDPLLQDTPEDIYISVVRGQNSFGNIILPPISAMSSSYKIESIDNIGIDTEQYIHPIFTFATKHHLLIGNEVVVYGVGGNLDGDYLVEEIITEYSIKLKCKKLTTVSLSFFDSQKVISRAIKKNDSYIERISSSEYNFVYKIPENLYPGIYTALIKTVHNGIDQISEINFQVSQNNTKSTIKISGYKVLNGIVTIYTADSHNLSVGDYVYVYGAANLIDGNYYIANIQEADQFNYKLNIKDKDYTSVYPYGSVSYVNTEGISPILSGPSEPTKISYRPLFDSIKPYSTNSVLLIRTRWWNYHKWCY